MTSYDHQARLFKALNHPARLAILDVLRDGEHCVCHIEAVLGYRQAYISQQLMVLRDAGLVQDRGEGWNIFYRGTKPEVFAVIDAAWGVVGTAQKGMRHRKAQVEACPCPKCSPAAEAVAH